ncbi:MAG: HDOD domain-containing protein [Planctomycetaceae bacterium]|nr:HDOD domain-containing protein [Planctomycetaceae bacterium]
MASILPNVSARNAAFALYQLDTPAVHPDSVIRCIKAINEYKPALASVAQTDPAVAIALVNLFRQHNIEFNFENLNFEQCVNEIPTNKILKTFLNIKTFDITGFHSQIPIAKMNGISAVRAYTAKLIAAQTNMNESLAFFAALFADIGLLALAELYPKSLAGMYEDAAGDSLSLLRMEKENLGLTHNVISRQLAQKWLLPQVVADCGWLYCSPAADKLETLPNFEYIMIVRLADIIAKNIDNGGSITIPSAIPISPDDVNEINEKARNFASQLNTAEEKPESQIIKQALMTLLDKPVEQNITDFQNNVWNAVKPVVSTIEAAGIICGLICKKLNVQKACIYLNAGYEAVKTIGDNTEFMTFEAMPTNQQINFADAGTTQIKLDAIGQMFLQTMQDLDVLAIANIVTQVLTSKSAEEYNLSIAQALLENFTPAVRPTQPTPPTTPAPQPMIPPLQPQAKPQSSQTPPTQQTTVQTPQELQERIAEIAAGAAHELNNPLTVISGRAQLLKQQETDPTKRLMLEQITEKTGQAYEIVGQLMSYARPSSPQIRTVSPFIMINNCIEKVNARYLDEPVDITIDSSIENLSDIEVDSEQIVEAISQIMYNSLESYESGNGPVIISGSEHVQGFVEIRIQDQGCGMSEETLQKAAEPFYSDKPAGRQRGMGLALAASLLQNNGGKISFDSQIDKGTTVSVQLPKTGKSE